jgi:hypothetical protein
MSRRDRRSLVSFDPDHFGKEAAAGRGRSPRDAFRHAWASNHWRGISRSGPGSGAEQTAGIARAIPALCARLGVRTLLDLPCGDFSWMARVELEGIAYLGADIVPEIVAANALRYARSGRTFLELDVTSSNLPAADLVLCRDCLVHLSFADAKAALRNVLRGGASYLLTTTFPEEPVNVDVTTGDWRPLDLTRPPFGLPRPLELLVEGCTENEGAFADKSLGLWRLADLRASEALA